MLVKLKEYDQALEALKREVRKHLPRGSVVAWRDIAGVHMGIVFGYLADPTLVSVICSDEQNAVVQTHAKGLTVMGEEHWPDWIKHVRPGLMLAFANSMWLSK